MDTNPKFYRLNPVKIELYTFYLVGLFLRYNLTAAVTKWPGTFTLYVVKDMCLCSFTKSRKEKKKKVNRASKDLPIARMVWHKTYLGSEAATWGGAGPQAPSKEQSQSELVLPWDQWKEKLNQVSHLLLRKQEAEQILNIQWHFMPL